MINLHQKFNHYLNTDKILDMDGVHERIISYGWMDDGTNLTGYYVLTENFELVFDLQDKYRENRQRPQENLNKPSLF